jgi:hypothetical protein
VLVAFAVALLATTQFDDDTGLRRELRYPRNQSERPLTIMNDLFAVWGRAGGGQLTGDSAVIYLGAGAVYGMSDDLQVELELLRLDLSSVPGTGLRDPLGAVTYRATRGVFELGARASSTIPFGGAWTLSASIPMLFRVAPFARIELVPEARASAVKGWLFDGNAVASATIQIGDAIALGPIARIASVDFGRKGLLLAGGGRATYTFGEKMGSIADLSLTVISRSVALVGSLPDEPNAARFFSAAIELRWYIEDTIDSPFEEEL